MSGPIGSSQWMYNPSTSFYDYTIDQSLRFNDDDSAELTRTPSSAGNRQTWTLSCWVKRSNLPGTSINIFSTANSGPGYTIVRFHPNNKLYFYANTGNSQLISDAIFRDTSAWLHVMAVQDSTNTTAADRMILYVNGEKVSQSYDATYGTLALNFEGSVNNTVQHNIGSYASSQFFDGYMAEYYLIDGQALTPTSFGETNNGVWTPKSYSGSFGTNGFYLSFADSSSIGDDLSGNNNDFTPSNLAASDVVPDSPTNNFCTLNPLAYTNGITLSEGNLTMSTTTNNRGVHGTMPIPSSGKWYWELHVDSRQTGGGIYAGFGSDASLGYDEVAQPKGIFVSLYNQTVDLDNSTASSPYNSQGNDSVSNGDIFSFALDVDNQIFYVAKNGTYRGSSDPSAGTGGLDVSTVFTNAVTELTVCLTRGGSFNETYSVNFGQDSKDVASANADSNGIGTFEYAVPTGFLALCTANLPEPTIGPNSTTQADDYFDIALYSGNGTAVASGGNAITSVNFAPEFVWLKRRDAAANHAMYSVVQGAGVGVIPSQDSYSSFNDAETLNSFDSNGFTLGSNNIANATGSTNIGWNWKLGGTPSVDNSAGAGAVPTAGSVKIDGSNSTAALAGTIPALRQSVNTTAGISITKYVGTGANATIAHSLTETPELVICKNMDDTKDFMVFCDVFAATQYLRLNGPTDGIKVLTSSSAIWNDTAPSSTVVSLGTSSHVNTLNDNHIMWAFHSVEGYCKITEYSSNGNADGPFCFLGFRPRLVIIRRTSTSSTGRWPMYNTETYTYNSDTEVFFRANQNDAEISASTRDIDILSNGIKIRNTSGNINASSGEKYLVIAWAENPFKYANAR